MIKKHLNKIISLGIISVSLLAFKPTGASAEWKSDPTGWWYTEGSSYSTGWKLIDGNWYYFYSDGYMAHDTTIDGYSLNSNGAWHKNSLSKEEAIKILLSNYREFVETPNASDLKTVKNQNTGELYYALGCNLRTPGTDNIKPYYLIVNVSTGEHEAYGPSGQIIYFENYVEVN